MEVSCPKCGNKVLLDHSTGGPDGLLRTTCGNCDKKILIKLNQRDLKLDGDIPISDPAPREPEPQRESEDGADETVPELWAVVVADFPSESETALRAVLAQIPRFSRNPNKIFDLLSHLPYVLSGLSFEEVSRLEACLQDCGSTFLLGPEREIVDARGQPLEIPKVEAGATEEQEAGEPPPTAAAPSDPSEDTLPTPERVAQSERVAAEVLLLSVESGVDVADWLGLVSARRVITDEGGAAPSSQALDEAELDARDALARRALDAGADAVMGVRSSLSSLHEGSTVLTLEGTAIRRVTPSEGT